LYLDLDSVTLWIRIRIGNSDTGMGTGSRGKKIKKIKLKNGRFSHIFLIFTTESKK
jgi:hypothetical protein